MMDVKNCVIVLIGLMLGIGKSFLMVNFVVLFVYLGKCVLLIDVDMWCGMFDCYFGFIV